MTNPTVEDESNGNNHDGRSSSPADASNDTPPETSLADDEPVRVDSIAIDQEENQVEKELRDLGHDPTIPTSPVHRTVTVPHPSDPKSNADEYRRLKPFEIYKYADRSDVYLMIVGSIAAVLTGVCYPFMLIFYRRVINSLADLGKMQSNATVTNITSPGTCSLLPSAHDGQSPGDVIQGIVKYYIILGFVSIVFYWIAWASWIIAAERQVRRIRYALFRNIVRQEIGWFDVHNAGELSSRLIDDLDKIKDGINEKMPEFLSLLARTLGAIVFALITGWKLALVFLSVAPLIIITFNLTIRIIVKYTMKEVQAFASASSIAQEVLQSIRTVTAFHGQKKEEERFATNLTEATRIGIRKGTFMGICQAVSQILFFLAFTITFWYGPHLVRTECANYTPGSVIVIFVACMVATFSASQFVPNFQNFAEASGSASYVFGMIERKTKIDASSDEGSKPDSVVGDIEFDNVTFTYPARQDTPILNALSLKIPSGKTVALVGASGCGKSTTIQMIQRFYDPEDGRVLLDGKDIRTLNAAWLRSHIGIVSQEPVLFTGTIEENIRFGKTDATDDEVQNAAKMANAHDFIMALPQQYKTNSGDKLSGGQKQRVAIARALISNPKILLLDEATSALDNTSERIVQDALDKAKEGRTTIVIAHRLSTIRNADLIAGFERGRVHERGTHDELMLQKGLYYELVSAQTQHEKEPQADSDREDEDEVERKFVREKSLNRSLSRQSSTSCDDVDGNDVDLDDATSSMSLSRTKRWFRTPFLFRVMKYNAPERYWILLGSIAALVLGMIQPLFALVFSKIYGLFAEPSVDKQQHETSMYAGLIFAIGFIGAVAQFLCFFSFSRSGEYLTLRMRKLTFAALLRQEMGYFDYEANSVGALVTRLSSDASSLKGLTGARTGIVLQAVSATVTALIIALAAGWKLTLVVICFVPLILLNGLLQGKKQSTAGVAKDKGSFTEQGGQYATQAIEQIRTVVALHREKHFIDLYEGAFDQDFKKQMCHLHATAIGAAIANSMMYFLQGTSFGYGSKLAVRGEMPFDHVLRVFVVITFAMMSVGRTMSMMSDYSKAKAAALRIIRLDKRVSEINPHDESGIILNDVVGDVEFRDVRFRYPSRPTVRILRKFSLKCAARGTTAFVGPSGSGKSTTVALLERFYDPLRGKVFLDGHDIKVLNLRWLRSMMGLVQQEPTLFNLSIRDNIAYGDNSRTVTQEEIETAARMANIHDLIIALPQGYDTSCGVKGGQLSGGQKQRIAIARALLRSPKLLLLDEATSALDNKSEKIVQDTLDQARTGRTCLTIAHRLSTIQHSEKIAVVDRGQMKEEGTHDELIALNGTYAKLVAAQERST